MTTVKKIIITIFVIIGYQLIHQLLDINQTILPSIDQIVISFIQNFQSIAYNSMATIAETLVGLSIAIVLALLLSIIINESKLLKAFVINFISVIQIIPIIAVAPLIIMWFGIGYESKVLLVIIYSVFSIVITTTRAFSDISNSHYLYIRSLTTNKYKMYRYLYFPLASNEIFSGIKIATTYSVVSAISGEYLGGKVGIGILISRAYSSYQTALVFALIAVIIAITFSLLAIVNRIEKMVIK
ncbi:MAG: ABC transporter permease [Bacilli bacterium]